MTRKEAIEIAYEMGGHPYSLISMVDAMMKGAEIGKKEQKAVDDKRIKEYLEKKRDALAEISRHDFYDISNAFGGVKYLDEIINELFKEK